ncbi:hypothetical protein TVAG_421570 [Trichomonas vaginalis G3]|uniref:BAR domain-containing protein n=1 Tax=Trichomonas vaginalis (strain ATCC PRA-98 / G3) TaxID=412133 RepID=A2FR44_TRIV3|nr:hypothetical protein TVAGG3_0030630 [Trichomonas vaginalis G3]EAX92633.1 hypothetical protein TVAG_421570 [Trichomonas vaginalis G3]KAI5540091.1 hypothetical protein TVAGG3_0030630 [Trichomonas vaginalis G3]|eukprot:XP_001305563.1 hypothetical protein [Trichomonas vaginalis G3]
MFNFLKSKKEILVNDMKEVYEGLKGAAEGRMKYANGWKDFANYTKIMVLSQNSTIQPQMDRFVDLFTKVAECQQKIAEAELRNAEDFNDVSERFAVVFRKNNEYNDQKRTFREYEANLKDAIAKNEAESKKPNYAKSQQKLEAAIEKYKSLKAEALELTKQRLRDVIEAREAYNKFKVRRFQHGWILYGQTLRDESQKEASYLKQIEELLLSLKSDLESGKISEIQDQIQTHIEAAPEPVDVVAASQALEAPAPEIPQPAEEPQPVEEPQHYDEADTAIDTTHPAVNPFE